MSMSKAIRQGCEAFVAYVKEVPKKKLDLKMVLVVYEFTNVFFDELPGLPPDQKIKFEINLFPEIEPISKPPY